MIELPITQNVIVEYKLAPLGKRIFAQVMDVTAYLIFWLTLMAISSMLNIRMSLYYEFIGFISFVGYPMYYALMEALNKGQTLGKSAMGIRVINQQGDILTFSQTILRSVLLLIDFLLSIGVIGCLFITATRNRQRIGDLAAATLVVETIPAQRKSLLDNYSEQTLYTRTPEFPNVRFLKEDDVVLIKEVIARYEKSHSQSDATALNLAYKKVCNILGTKQNAQNLTAQSYFLVEIIKDYIVVTR